MQPGANDLADGVVPTITLVFVLAFRSDVSDFLLYQPWARPDFSVPPIAARSAAAGRWPYRARHELRDLLLRLTEPHRQKLGRRAHENWHVQLDRDVLCELRLASAVPARENPALPRAYSPIYIAQDAAISPLEPDVFELHVDETPRR